MRKAADAVLKEAKKKKKVSILKVAGILFTVYFIFTVCDQQMQINKYNSQIDMYEENIQSTNSLAKYYSNQKSSIQSDDYIETIARDKLGYVKPNEKIFIDANR